VSVRRQCTRHTWIPILNFKYFNQDILGNKITDRDELDRLSIPCYYGTVLAVYIQTSISNKGVVGRNIHRTCLQIFCLYCIFISFVLFIFLIFVSCFIFCNFQSLLVMSIMWSSMLSSKVILWFPVQVFTNVVYLERENHY